MNPTPLEKDIERKIGEYAKKKGCIYQKNVSPAHRAVPDRLIITPHGTVGFLEIKRKGCKPTPLQMRELTRLREAKCNVAWMDSVEGGTGFIDVLLRIPGQMSIAMGEGLCGPRLDRR